MQARSAFRRGIGEQNFEKRITSLSYFHAFHTLGVISISDRVTPGFTSRVCDAVPNHYKFRVE